MLKKTGSESGSETLHAGEAECKNVEIKQWGKCEWGE